jgi:DNA (cytosine-5)-methyltransferase 1
MLTDRSLAAVDLFCGAGGLSLGLQESGIEIRAGIDLDPECRFAYEHNIGAKFLNLDVASLDPALIEKLFVSSKVKILAGCAPCQPFSGYTTKRRNIDHRWRLLLDFLRLATATKPDIVTMENVSRLAILPIWQTFVAGLKKVGYSVSWKILNAAEYGVPQNRKRLVLIGSRLGNIQLPEPKYEEALTVRATIGDLPPTEAGKQGQDDPLHTARALTARNLERIRNSRPSGTWKEWPEEMRARCHKTDGGKTYPSVYGRMSWDAPAPTITTQFYGFGNGRFGHPEQDRAITLREGALLQSFPAQFQFTNPNSRTNFRKIGKLIGNAVPPSLAVAIGEAIVLHISSI